MFHQTGTIQKDNQERKLWKRWARHKMRFYWIMAVLFVGFSAWGKKTQNSKNLKIFVFIVWNPVYWALGKSYGKPELFTSHSQVMGQDRKLLFQLWLGSNLLCFIIITLVWEWNYWWSGAWFPCQHKTSTNKDLVAKIHTSQHTIL